MAMTVTECEPIPAPDGLRAGMRASVPILPAVAPFGLLFGALARETGFDLVQSVAMAAGIASFGALTLAGL